LPKKDKELRATGYPLFPIMTRIRKRNPIVYLILLLHAQTAIADNQDESQSILSNSANETIRSPRTNAERREEGFTHEITPWLAGSMLVDLEWRRDDFSTRNGNDDTFRERSTTFQLGLIAAPWEYLQGELSFEYDTATKNWITDEAFILLEIEDWELMGGKLYTPFGEYISHFPSGPLLEFGETQTRGISLAYSPGDLMELSLTAYRGQAREVGDHSSRLDWTAAIAATIDDRYIFGLSYQSDLADANSSLVADTNNRYQRKVDAASGYFIWLADDFEVSFEVLGALDSFRELESDRDQPLAWNLEFTHFIDSDFEWALRAEGSRELEDEPEWQLGTALTWHVNHNISCSIEYLHGHFKKGMATNDADESYDHVDRIGVQISVGF
jgi:hypothetical protein